ncbi:hex2 protein [Paraphaeosphaeria sporulosa]
MQSMLASSLSLDLKSEDEPSSSNDGGRVFPAYSVAVKAKAVKAEALPSSSLLTTFTHAPTATPMSTLDHATVSEDDTDPRPEPSQHADYLLPDWKADNIWSWLRIVSSSTTVSLASGRGSRTLRGDSAPNCSNGLRAVTPKPLNRYPSKNVADDRVCRV